MVEAEKIRISLLLCGVIAPLLFIGTDILAGALYSGYDFVDQSISELSAIGAPTRSLVVSLNIVYYVLLIAFVVGIWVSVGKKRLQRLTSVMLLGNVIVSLIWVFFPMQVGQPASNINVVLGAMSMIFYLLAIGFGAVAFRGSFRLFSTGILLAFLILTIFGIMAATSHIGVQERTMSYSYVAWQAVLSIVLLQIKK